MATIFNLPIPPPGADLPHAVGPTSAAFAAAPGDRCQLTRRITRETPVELGKPRNHQGAMPWLVIFHRCSLCAPGWADLETTSGNQWVPQFANCWYLLNSGEFFGEAWAQNLLQHVVTGCELAW